ncbi:transporter substrate-binding domain-containing protein [Clostridium bovifaecis]|uniref:Transporter substrate-binding domain-containing protein n=1 Tax=Clostridium bovifaecis TaxID=2184719 RepID=A0A6I6F842_9CLOT|nr:transporter substrate-binding domain-containing protein [Clostridium bovifaecis]
MIKNKKVKAIVCGLVLSLGATLFVGCGNKAVEENKNNKQGTEQTSDASKTASKIDEIKKAGKLVLGTCADYPPYEFQVMKDGKSQIVGFDIEIAKEIAKDLGVELEIKDMDFDGLIPSLKTGKVDLVISGMTPTAERKKEIDFSKIYYKAVQSVIVRDEDKAKFNTIESLSPVKIGAQTSSIQEKIAKEQIKAAKVTSLGKVTELVLSLKTKKVDAIVVEYPVAKAYVEKEKDIVLSDVKVEDPDGGSAIGIEKGNTDLVEAVDKTIDRLVSEDKINKFVADANAIEQ